MPAGKAAGIIMFPVFFETFARQIYTILFSGAKLHAALHSCTTMNENEVQ